ncbi:MAG: endonuclease/exonuclease/phosphatase family protein [Bacteroidales bacterium]|nr:endonuclease/exonuclease/phosphatase family protein [Bacteroidales bacterium]
MRNVLFTLFIFIRIFVSAQQSVKVMHYNLLNFGTFTDYCTINNNDPAEKSNSLKTIVDFYIPDILIVNEISPSAYYQDLILNNVMNVSGRDYFQRAQASNLAGSEIVNMLYFNSDKLGLSGQDVISHYLRDMNVYKLFYKSSGLSAGSDTSFLYMITAHFKAGVSGDDKIARGQMAQLIMNYIVNHEIEEACLVCGDFNLQNNLEPAWLNLTSSAPENFRLSDPANMEGIWHNNQDFATVHSQSTNITSNGCMASGGMDDRFDFIMINSALENDENAIRYIPQSYNVPGQDGLRLNGSLLNPPNFSAPSEVLNAMYHFSDHLPVMVELEVEDTPVLPPSWSFTPTMNTHIISLPLACMPTLNQAPLPPGSYIGAFFIDGLSEKCAGNILWSGNENVALVAYGNDLTTNEKDGFDEGEPIVFKVFSVFNNSDFYADAGFDVSLLQNDGNFLSGGISAISRLDAFYLQYHTIDVGSGWNAVSSFLIPKWRTLKSVLGTNLPHVGFATNGSEIYYPAGGIQNDLSWNSSSTFLIKSTQSFSTDVEGVPVSNLSFNLNAGWNIIFVPVPRYVGVEEISSMLGNTLAAIKSIAGTAMFWPGKNISTLQVLEPGNAYYIYVSQSCLLTF